ncbi:MAG TPA: hypothetical protein VIM34_13090, partial [Burkholderiaceae bacterium]
MECADPRRDLRAQFTIGNPHVVLRLQIQPETRLHPEEEAKPVAGVNYPGRPATTILAGWGRGGFLDVQSVLAVSFLTSFSMAVWQAKR